MEVKISFDTEKESLEDLKKLVDALQDLITKREKNPNLTNTVINTTSQQRTDNIKQNNPAQQAISNSQTGGGGKLIPYEDMTDTMSKIFSGRM